MKHALTSNYPSRSICVNLLDHLELRLDLLSSLLHRKDKSPPHRKGGPPSHTRGLVEADVDILKVRFDRVQLAVSLPTSLVTPRVAFYCKTSLVLPLPDKKSADL